MTEFTDNEFQEQIMSRLFHSSYFVLVTVLILVLLLLMIIVMMMILIIIIMIRTRLKHIYT